MKRQQFLVAGIGVFLLLVLYFFGQTVPSLKKPAMPANGSGSTSGESPSKTIDLQDILQTATSRLNPARMAYINRLEHSVVRGDIKEQQLKADRQLASFWKDSVSDGALLYAYYTGESAKLENSEKSLTFAAQLFLQGLRGQDDQALKGWMAQRAKELFEKALELNPGNDSSKVGLGASTIFGASSGSLQETMQGIQQILEVARRDTTNMYAQFMLGWGGIESGQLDKAVIRLNTVIRHEPGNIEARLLLAGTKEQMGDKTGAIKEYEEIKRRIGDPDMIRQIDRRIQSLR